MRSTFIMFALNSICRGWILKGLAICMGAYVSARQVMESEEGSVTGSGLLEVEVNLEEGACIPVCASEGAAGYDLYSNESKRIAPGEQVMIDTGVSMAIPNFLYGQIAGRSGLCFKKDLDVHRGVIDSDYRGSIKLIVRNTGSVQTQDVQRGERVAQILFLPIARPFMKEVDNLEGTSRGSGGFGSTGMHAVTVEEAPAMDRDSQGSSQ